MRFLKDNIFRFVTELVGQENTICSVMNALNGKLPTSGVFSQAIRFLGNDLWVTVIVRDEVLQLSNLGVIP